MLKVDSDEPELSIELLYPGGYQVVEWQKCELCDREVDGYIFESLAIVHGYCWTHFDDLRREPLPF
jgi:hypothetical protein